MNNELDLVRHLYGELDHPEQLEASLARNAELAEEYQSLQEVKQALDGRSLPRPNAAVLDAILAAAAPVPHGPRQDRQPIAHRRVRRFDRLRIAGAAMLTVLLVSIGIFQFQPSSNPGTSPVIAQKEVPQEARPAPFVAQSIPEETVVEEPAAEKTVTPTPAEAPRVAEVRVMATSRPEEKNTKAIAAEPTEEPVEEWDAAPDVQVLQRRFDMLENRATPTGWGQAIAPASAFQNTPGLRPAGN